MELFSLLAKLTLDKSEYDKSINEAESQAKGIDVKSPSLGLNDDEFYQAVEEAENVDIDDPDSPDLDLDDSGFQDTVEEAEETDVDDPDEPELDLDNQPYTDALEEAGTATDNFEAGIGDTLANIKGLIAGAGIAAAIIAVVDYLGEAVDLARQTGDNIDKSSRAMSLSTDAYQEWAHVLDINGASITDLNRGLMNMRKLMGGGEVGEETAKAFEKLGLSARVANGEITSTEQLLDASLKALADFEGSAEDRDVLAQALFGRGGTKLNALFDGTSDDIEYLKQQAHDLGIVMSEDAVSAAAEYNDAVTNMNASIEALKVSIGETLLPIMTDLAKQVTMIAVALNPRNKTKSLAEMWADGDEEFSEELLTIEETATAAESLADKLISMGDTSKMTADQYAIWKGTAEELIKLVPSLGDIIDIESGQIKANSDEIKENIKQWENLAKQKALQSLKEEKYQAIVQKNKELINQSVEANKKAAEADGKRAESFRRLNEVLTANGFNALDEGATYEQAQQAVTNALLGYNGDEYGLAKLSAELTGAQQEWATAEAAAIGAQNQADKLKAELEEGEKEYQEWLKAAEDLYGIQFEEAKSATEETEEYKKVLDGLPHNVHTVLELEYQELNPRPFATGSAYIPYDNFPALLHRGEKVITATEARKGANDGIDYTRLEDSIIASIRAGMADASVTAVVTDRDVAKGSNRYNGNEMDSRRFRP